MKARARHKKSHGGRAYASGADRIEYDNDIRNQSSLRRRAYASGGAVKAAARKDGDKISGAKAKARMDRGRGRPSPFAPEAAKHPMAFGAK